MYKQTIDIWIATHSMFTHQSHHLQPENTNMHPFCFKDVRLKDTIYDLYKFAKSVKLISDGVDLTHCFYYIHLKQQDNYLLKQDYKTTDTTTMLDQKQQSLLYQHSRQSIYTRIINSASTNQTPRTDFTDFNITIKKLLKYHLGQNYKLYPKLNHIQMTIYIMWKQASFQLKNNLKKIITLPVLKTQTFNQLYRRALHQCEQLHQNIRMIIYKCGPQKQQVYLAKHRIYQSNTHSQEEAKNLLNIQQHPSLQQKKRAFKISDPNGEIYQIGEVYRFRLLNLHR